MSIATKKQAKQCNMLILSQNVGWHLQSEQFYRRRHLYYAYIIWRKHIQSKSLLSNNGMPSSDNNKNKQPKQLTFRLKLQFRLHLIKFFPASFRCVCVCRDSIKWIFVEVALTRTHAHNVRVWYLIKSFHCVCNCHLYSFNSFCQCRQSFRLIRT